MKERGDTDRLDLLFVTYRSKICHTYKRKTRQTVCSKEVEQTLIPQQRKITTIDEKTSNRPKQKKRMSVVIVLRILSIEEKSTQPATYAKD
jgi:hypothetical protein